MKKSAILLAFLLILISLIPTTYAAADLTHTQEYIPESHAELGWIGYPSLTVAADGSFSLEDTVVQFGCTTKIAHINRSAPYPSTTHTFSDGTLYYSLHLFVNERDFDGTPCLVLYARLTVENLTKESASFPAVSARLTALTNAPGELSPEGKAACDYAVILHAGENDLSTLEKEAFGTFDENAAAMEEFWDKQLADSFAFTKIPEEAQSYAAALQTGYVNLLCGIPTNEECSLAALLLKAPANTAALSCFDTALYFMKTADTAFLDSVWETLQSKYQKLCDDLEVYTFTVSEQEEEVRLLSGKKPDTALEENLNALTELKAFAFLCREKDPSLEDTVLTDYQKLLSSVETVMRNTVSYCTSHWSVTDLPGSLSQGIFTLSAKQSACIAVNWYKKDSVFSTPAGGGTYLKRLARQQLPYAFEAGFPHSFSFADSIVFQTEDDTVIIGQGLPGAWLTTEEPLSFENYPLSDGHTIGCTISGKENEIRVKLSPTAPTAVSLEFPVFLNNIEYASCGFDSENGIVSVPAGITEITVRLKKDIETTAQTQQNEHALEAAIAAFEGIHLGEYTKYSVSLFSPALENAKAARTGPASEMHKAAAELQKAAAKLSKIQSAYTLSLYQESNTSAGDLEADEILQTFASKKAGTLSEIFIKGTYSEGITAVIYSLQKDGVSPGDLLGEAKGKATSTGIVFSFSIELEADTGYLLSVFSETGTITLPVYHIPQDAPILYAKTGNGTVAYDLTCIGAALQITQANLEDLDIFLEKCISTDISSYTKESRNRLEKEIKTAKELLCTQSVSSDEYKTVYTDLKEAYAALATYPSDAPVEKTPAALYVVLGIAALLLIGGGVGAVASYKKREW